MTNKERHKKLKQAKALIREVEFSYPTGHLRRRLIYSAVVQIFSITGFLGGLISELRDQVRKEENDQYYV